MVSITKHCCVVNIAKYCWRKGLQGTLDGMSPRVKSSIVKGLCVLVMQMPKSSSNHTWGPVAHYLPMSQLTATLPMSPASQSFHLTVQPAPTLNELALQLC